MQAVKYARGSASGRRWVDDAPKPTAGPGKLVVKVAAAGINPVDFKLPKWVMNGAGVGLDFAGVVEQVGPEVSGFEVGDRVFGNTRGTLADFCLCSANKVAKIPQGLGFVDAAAMPTAYLTGYQALRENGFEAGLRLLIIGASGGCGTAGIQLAKAMGAAEIVAVCSGKNEELVVGLGADRIVDYTKTTVAKALGADAVDFVYDCATGSGHGEDYVAASKAVLKRGGDPSKGQGMYVAINGGIGAWLRKLTGLQSATSKLMMTQHSRKDLEGIVALMNPSGDGETLAFKPIIDTVLPFTQADVEKGFDRLKSRRARGKVVFEMATSE